MKFSTRRSYGPTPRYERVVNYKRNDRDFIVIGGPCSVESCSQIERIAREVSLCGATHLRGGVFRAGTYPGSLRFGWVDEALIARFYEVAQECGLKNIIEVLDYSPESLDLISQYCDVFQVGARAMQNYTLLRKLGSYGKPVFLKRNTGATVDEWLGAAEHLLVGGVEEIALIERGSSTFHNDVRWTPCIHVIPSVASITEIPVIIDASHGTGRRDLVSPITLAGVAAGAGGVLVETHYSPDESLSDAEQAISLEEFSLLMNKIKIMRGLS